MTAMRLDEILDTTRRGLVQGIPAYKKNKR